MAVFISKVVEDFIGKGIGWPLEIENGRPKIITGPPLILSSIKIITSWPKRTKFMDGDFGSLIHNSLEEPNHQIMDDKITSHFKDTITEYEPRVEDINVSVSHEGFRKVNVNATYRIINHPTPETNIFPFSKP